MSYATYSFSQFIIEVARMMKTPAGYSRLRVQLYIYFLFIIIKTNIIILIFREEWALTLICTGFWKEMKRRENGNIKYIVEFVCNKFNTTIVYQIFS